MSSETGTSSTVESVGPSAFHIVSKPVGPICNLDCKYCFYLKKEALYPGENNWGMPDTVLEAFVRQYIEAQKVAVVTFPWQGGEPTLLGVEYFEKAVALQKKYANGKHIRNALQTNGILVDDRWGEFFAREGFLVGLSIDGPRELHDYYRVDKGGQPTFDRVMRGLQWLQEYGVEFNTLTTVHRANSQYPIQVYRFLKQVGSAVMQFIPIVERIEEGSAATRNRRRGWKAQVSPHSVEPLQYGRFLCAIFDEWVRHDVGRHFVQTFDVALESCLGIPQSLCIFHETCGAALAMEHNGDVYSCDHFVAPENKLGNLLAGDLRLLVQSRQQRQFGAAKRASLPAYCRECDVRFACNGECPKNRFARTPDGEEGLNYLCRGYKLFFRHIRPYMDFMVAQFRAHEPVRNVMEWVKQNDNGVDCGITARNAFCPCGSGRKYKRCCSRSRR